MASFTPALTLALTPALFNIAWQVISGGTGGGLEHHGHSRIESHTMRNYYSGLLRDLT